MSPQRAESLRSSQPVLCGKSELKLSANALLYNKISLTKCLYLTNVCIFH